MDKLVSTIEFRGMLDVYQAYAATYSSNLCGYLIAVGTIQDEQARFNANDPLLREEAFAELNPRPPANV